MRISKIVLPFIIVLTYSFINISCQDDFDDNVNTNTNPPNNKELTYLIYMVGQNDLSGLLNGNIYDLMTGLKSTNADANVLVYADITQQPELYQLCNENGNIIKKTIKTYPDQYSVSPKVMRTIISDIFVKFPANKYAITFSSHADGSLYRSNVVQKRSFGYEGDEGYGMNITDIKFALKDLPQIELIMFDACLMSSIETAYEFKDITHYMLASPNSVPGEGFPYDKVLPSLLQMDKDGISNAASIYMDHFLTNEVEWDDFVSICACDVKKLDSVALYMDSLFQDPVVAQRPETIKREKLQFFESGYPLYDFGHWLDCIGEDSKYLDDVKRVFESAVIYKGHSDYTTVNDYTEKLENPITDEQFSGFNTYVPSPSKYSELVYKAYFTKLAWYKDAGFWRTPYYSWYE